MISFHIVLAILGWRKLCYSGGYQIGTASLFLIFHMPKPLKISHEGVVSSYVHLLHVEDPIWFVKSLLCGNRTCPIAKPKIDFGSIFYRPLNSPTNMFKTFFDFFTLCKQLLMRHVFKKISTLAPMYASATFNVPNPYYVNISAWNMKYMKDSLRNIIIPNNMSW